MKSLGPAFVAQSREYLTGHYLPKILGAIAHLEDADLWWRPGEHSNSIGNLMLHLAGNIRQWIVSGVGGTPDARDRPAEFASRGGHTRADLVARLSAAVDDADRALAGLDPATLLQEGSVQGRQVSRFQAVYHAVEHFGMHTGQILYIAKLRSGMDLGFYRMEDGVLRAAWPGHPTSGSA